MIIGLLFIVSGISVGLYLYNKKHRDLSKAKPDFILTAHELLSAFENDEASASVKFINKVIEVSGLVSSVEFGSADSTLSITLTGKGNISGVICTFNGITNQSQVRVKVNQEVFVRGECSGMLMDVLLNNCFLVLK